MHADEKQRAELWIESTHQLTQRRRWRCLRTAAKNAVGRLRSITSYYWTSLTLKSSTCHTHQSTAVSSVYANPKPQCQLGW